MVVCAACDGRKSEFLMVSPWEGEELAMVPCAACQGTGEVSEEQDYLRRVREQLWPARSRRQAEAQRQAAMEARGWDSTGEDE